MNNHRYFLTSILVLLISLSGCEKTVDEREADELLRLEAYISIHYPNAIKTASGLYYIINDEGDSVNGLKPGTDDYVIINYTNMDLDGDVFETNNDSIAKKFDIYSSATRYIPAFRKLSNKINPLVAGLSEGLGLINEGGKARLILPSRLAYGGNKYKTLPPFSSVIIDVELLRVVKDPNAYEQELIDNYLDEFYPEAILDSIRIDSMYFLAITEKIPADDHHTSNSLYTQPTDQEIKDNDIVSVFYQGRFLDNFLFDTNIQSVSEEDGTYDANKSYVPIKVTVGGSGYIDGFSVALRHLTTYTYAKVIIPSYLAYKENGSSTIPPFSPLIFELDVLGKKSTGTEAED